MGRKQIDRNGEVYGRLTVLDYVRSDRHGNHYWRCVCECGRRCLPTIGSLKSGAVVSCGCYNRESRTTHGRYVGDGKYPEYKTWIALFDRCDNPECGAYKDYGERGITICDRWRGADGFRNFLADMGNRPSPSHSLDRKNANGNYEPDNCRWATKEEQQHNRRDNVRVVYKGVSYVAVELARCFGITDGCLRVRLRRGWDIERALRTPMRRFSGRRPLPVR